MPIDYTLLAQSKTGKTTKQRRAKRRRKTLKAAAATRDSQVMNRYGGSCIAVGVTPGCQQKAMDPHELIGVGAGGSRVDPDNRIPVCRFCHRECQGRVGGNRLIFGWNGKEDGRKPTATKLGTTMVAWRPNANSKLQIMVWR